MALLADTNLLLNHIKNSFIYGDETGICEQLIDQEMPPGYDFEEALNNNFTYFDNYNEDRRSPDIPCLSKEPQARKSSAEIRMKEVEQQRRLIPDEHYFIDTGQWPRELSETDIDEYFAICPIKPNRRSGESKLGKLLEKGGEVRINKFVHYAKFSAVVYSCNESETNFNEQIELVETYLDQTEMTELRDFFVYLWDYESQRNMNNPVKVRPLSGTKVSDFIGLVCWKYTEERRSPEISNINLEKLQLFMFEDEDDLDLEFGNLDKNDPIYKYHFEKLTLMECYPNTTIRKFSAKSKKSSIPMNYSVMSEDSSFVTQSHLDRMRVVEPEARNTKLNNSNKVALPQTNRDVESNIIVEIQCAHGASKFQFSPDTTLDYVMKHTMKKRNLLQHGGRYIYHLRSATDSELDLDLALTLSDVSFRHFTLFRDLSRKKPAIPEFIAEETPQVMLSSVADCLKQHYYTVMIKYALRKFNARMAVSGDKIEIEPQLSGGHLLRSKVSYLIKQPKLICIPINILADCTLSPTGTEYYDTTKVTIKLVHTKLKSLSYRSLHDSTKETSSTSSIGLPEMTNSKVFEGHEEGETSISSDLCFGSDYNISQYTKSVSKTSLNNLNKLTNHSISCQWSTGKLIYDQIMAIINLRDYPIRQQYLNSLK